MIFRIGFYLTLFKHLLFITFLDEDPQVAVIRSEEHTSELQSHSDLVCRLLLEKKKQNKQNILFLVALQQAEIC